ncbi:MAG: MBOAT family protein [Syntrophobacteraceae bacterium]|nr:MBOAT family protein [Syntrophobacteraceae bacterium]
MVFSSVVFLFFFLPVVWTAYFLSPSRGRNALLVLASFAFYGWGEREYLFVLLLSILFNYSVGLCTHFLERPIPANGPGEHPDRVEEGAGSARSTAKKWFLISGITVNLGLLAFYKYVHFALSTLAPVLGRSPDEWASLGVSHAPVGISFFTFHAISYLVDLYRHRATPRLHPVDFALYLSLFPKMLAGPIVPYHVMEHQLGKRRVTSEGFVAGIERFITGLAKKTLIANPLAAVADGVFSLPGGEVSFPLAWLGLICFSLQIYFDFSAYSDMAIGLGKTFGFDFPENFNFPYISQSVQEFWRRWHISLSQWFRDYLYIPLGGNRCSKWRTYFNLAAVFLLCGLWHGASLNFILWGGWYGLFLIAERTPLGSIMRASWRPLRHGYTMVVVLMGWLIFRGDTPLQSWIFLQAIVGLGPETSGVHYPGLFLNGEVILCMLIGTALCMPLSETLKNWAVSLATTPRLSGRIASWGLNMTYAAWLGTLFLVSCMSLAGGTHNPFIYFKF